MGLPYNNYFCKIDPRSISHKLNRALEMLPLHQDLTLNQINYLSKVLMI